MQKIVDRISININSAIGHKTAPPHKAKFFVDQDYASALALIASEFRKQIWLY
jgi:hypothetical protein